MANKSSQFEASILNIWRKGPETKEQANIIYKTNHISNIYDSSIIKSNSSYQSFETRFPIIPKVAVQYFNFSEINNDSIKIIRNQLFEKKSECIETLRKSLYI